MTDNNDWWTRGQRYDAPNGADSFLRIGNVLYRMNDRDTGFYELLILEDETAYGQNFKRGKFLYLDVRTNFGGELICTATTCTVRYDGPAVPYRVSPAPRDQEGLLKLGLQRLGDFDHRQSPARLYAVRDSELLVYLSGWIHDETSLQKLHVISRANNQTEIVFVGNLTEASIEGGPVQYRVDGSEHELCLWPTGVLDTGSWTQLGTDAVLEATSLNGYRITHDNEGRLVFFAPRG